MNKNSARVNDNKTATTRLISLVVAVLINMIVILLPRQLHSSRCSLQFL